MEFRFSPKDNVAIVSNTKRTLEKISAQEYQNLTQNKNIQRNLSFSPFYSMESQSQHNAKLKLFSTQASSGQPLTQEEQEKMRNKIQQTVVDSQNISKSRQPFSKSRQPSHSKLSYDENPNSQTQPLLETSLLQNQNMVAMMNQKTPFMSFIERFKFKNDRIRNQRFDKNMLMGPFASPDIKVSSQDPIRRKRFDRNAKMPVPFLSPDLKVSQKFRIEKNQNYQSPASQMLLESEKHHLQQIKQCPQYMIQCSAMNPHISSSGQLHGSQNSSFTNIVDCHKSQVQGSEHSLEQSHNSNIKMGNRIVSMAPEAETSRLSVIHLPPITASQSENVDLETPQRFKKQKLRQIRQDNKLQSVGDVQSIFDSEQLNLDDRLNASCISRKKNVQFGSRSISESSHNETNQNSIEDSFQNIYYNFSKQKDNPDNTTNNQDFKNCDTKRIASCSSNSQRSQSSSDKNDQNQTAESFVKMPPLTYVPNQSLEPMLPSNSPKSRMMRQLPQSQLQKSLTLREKLLAYVSFNKAPESSKTPCGESNFIAATKFFTLRRFQPKREIQISNKIRRAVKRLTNGKEIDAVTHQNIISMLSQLTRQQLNEFGANTSNQTILQLQFLNQNSAQKDKEFQYSCYLNGLKRHFRTFGLSKSQSAQVGKLIETSDHRRQDVKRCYVKYSKEQQMGFKLERLSGEKVQKTEPMHHVLRQSSPKNLIKSSESLPSLQRLGSSGFSPGKEDWDEWESLLQRKKPNLPELRPLLEPLDEFLERYVPLHQLKMQSRIEGVQIGFQQVASLQKQLFQAQQIRQRAIALKQIKEKQKNQISEITAAASSNKQIIRSSHPGESSLLPKDCTLNGKHVASNTSLSKNSGAKQHDILKKKSNETQMQPIARLDPAKIRQAVSKIQVFTPKKGQASLMLAQGAEASSSNTITYPGSDLVSRIASRSKYVDFTGSEIQPLQPQPMSAVASKTNKTKRMPAVMHNTNLLTPRQNYGTFDQETQNQKINSQIIQSSSQNQSFVQKKKNGTKYKNHRLHQSSPDRSTTMMAPNSEKLQQNQLNQVDYEDCDEQINFVGKYRHESALKKRNIINKSGGNQANIIDINSEQIYLASRMNSRKNSNNMKTPQNLNAIESIDLDQFEDKNNSKLGLKSPNKNKTINKINSIYSTEPRQKLTETTVPFEILNNKIIQPAGTQHWKPPNVSKKIFTNQMVGYNKQKRNSLRNVYDPAVQIPDSLDSTSQMPQLKSNQSTANFDSSATSNSVHILQINEMDRRQKNISQQQHEKFLKYYMQSQNVGSQKSDFILMPPGPLRNNPFLQSTTAAAGVHPISVSKLEQRKFKPGIVQKLNVDQAKALNAKPQPPSSRL